MSQIPETKLSKKKGKRKNGAYRAEDKGTYGAVYATEAPPTSEKPHTYQILNEPARPFTIPKPSECLPPPKADPLLQPSASVLFPPRGPSVPGVSEVPPSESLPMAPPPSDKVPPNATCEEVLQFTLNSSILSGTFEDVKILACSRRSQLLGRIGGVRALHANSALLRRALTSAHLLLDSDVLPDVLEDGDIRDIDDAFQTGHCEYLEDSDFEDGEIALEQDSEEQDDSEDDVVEETIADSAGALDVNEMTAHASVSSDPDPSSTERASKDFTEAPDVGTPRNVDDTPMKLPNATSEDACGNKHEERETGAPPEDAPNSKASASVHTPGGGAEMPAGKSSRTIKKKQGAEGGSHSGTWTVLAPDMAFQTLRTFIFYAYTGRVAFAPLRSQGLIYQDRGSDACQLPVCSPKSMYRLAVKYGNQPLAMQARADIQFKLSTHNILDELFSTFTARHPDIQDMELDFLLAHIKHPDITIRLPWWIDRFAQGQLVACADTFGKLIHKLACVATAPQNPSQFGAPKACPRGCWMPTICTQSRCGTCGYIMT